MQILCAAIETDFSNLNFHALIFSWYPDSQGPIHSNGIGQLVVSCRGHRSTNKCACDDNGLKYILYKGRRGQCPAIC